MYMLAFLKTIYQLSENWIKSEDSSFGQVPAAAALLSSVENTSASTVYFLLVYFLQISVAL